MTSLCNLPACLMDYILGQRNTLCQDEIWQPTMDKKTECVQLTLNKSCSRLAGIEKVLRHKLEHPPQYIVFKTMESHGIQQTQHIARQGTHFVLHADIIHETHYICFTDEAQGDLLSTGQALEKYISFTTFEILGRKYLDRGFYVENEKNSWIAHGLISNIHGVSFQFCMDRRFNELENFYIDQNAVPLNMYM